jgi:alpha-glucosidase
MPRKQEPLVAADRPGPGRAPWWRHAVFYEIYPRSFQDSNGDGIGDLPGITSRLDHLADLGVDAIWITPFYPSPLVDFGYDVSDYEDVDPAFGTLADLDELLAQSHRRGIRVVIDLVLNHTSDQHPWFRASRSSRNSPYRDWYIWRDARDGGPPNNWSSGFGPCAWTLDEATGQYYYHFYYPGQPDLNWRNPAVEEAMFGSVRFWLERGVDGFRLDAINWLFEDPDLRDNPVLPTLRFGSDTEYEQELKYNRDLPETHDVLRRLRSLVDEYHGDRVLIGEIWVPTLADLIQYYGPDEDELHLPFNFFFMMVPDSSPEALMPGGRRHALPGLAPAFRREVARAERAFDGRPATWVLSNHDLARAYDRYGAEGAPEAIAKLLATMLLTLRGAPFIYYGEEIGMATTVPATRDEVHDPVGRRYWPHYKGRDGVRTPMQWEASRHAGFTTGTPWLPVPASAAHRNVEDALQDPDSILSFYRRLIRVRRSSPALLHGEYQELGSDAHVFAYRRVAPQQTVLVLLHMSETARPLEPATLGADDLRRARVLLSTEAREPGAHVEQIELAPFEALVLELSSA